jgi:hypothetical protein
MNSCFENIVEYKKIFSVFLFNKWLATVAFHTLRFGEKSLTMGLLISKGT